MYRQEDPRFMHLRKKVAIFALVSIAVTMAAVLYIGMEKNLFSSKYELYFTAQKGTGFTRGMPVKLSGFRIGRVKSVSLNESATVDVVLEIDRKYERWIRTDTEARLVKEGLIGEMIIEISPGTPAKPALADNEQLVFVKTKALDELAEELTDQVVPVLLDLRDIIAWVNDPQGDVKLALRNIHLLAVNLEETQRQLDLLLGSARTDIRGVAQRIHTLLDDADQTVRTANRSLSLIEEGLPPLLADSAETMRNAARISGELATVSGESLPQVPVLLKSSGTLLETMGEVVDTVKGIWPISSFIDEPLERQYISEDSHD
jgi:phospholipid/cholesterol/gamma-HCH transport system substrate-binding protein